MVPLVEALGGQDDLTGVMEVDRSSFATPWSREMYEAELQNSGISFIVVLRTPECRVAGYCSHWLVVDEVHINNVAVRPEYRGRGFGRCLVEYVLREGRNRGAIRALLEVRRGNAAARQLYENLGFTTIGVRQAYYREPVEDALVLARELQNIESNPNT
ncbi:MAG: ribosomal protein S18-alanine N-acetyltransferase [Acidobacteria bacterium]|nr:ribosomal protein S18-alanine N-acetyltransferase [Acidobacteriota bacterium]